MSRLPARDECTWTRRGPKAIRVKAEGFTQLPVWTLQSKSPTGRLIAILNLNAKKTKVQLKTR